MIQPKFHTGQRVSWGIFATYMGTIIGIESATNERIEYRIKNDRGQYLCRWEEELRPAFQNQEPIKYQVSCTHALNTSDGVVLTAVLQVKNLDSISDIHGWFNNALKKGTQ